MMELGRQRGRCLPGNSWNIHTYFSRFELVFTVPAHILMTHPGFIFIFISPRFMLHSDLCQEGRLQSLKSEKVKANGLRAHFSLHHCSAGTSKGFFLGRLCSPRKPVDSRHKGWHHWPLVHFSEASRPHIHVLLYLLIVLQAEEQLY